MKLKNIVDLFQRGYNSITELHMSGYNSEVLKKILNGTVEPKEVEIFYENNKPDKVHVTYDNENTGHNIEFFILDRALQDFLKNQ